MQVQAIDRTGKRNMTQHNSTDQPDPIDVDTDAPELAADGNDAIDPDAPPADNAGR